MIDPKELMIGNIVKNPRYFKEWGQHLYQTVECICGIDISTNKEDWDADYLEPVELTPEILEAAGFHWSIYHQAYHFGDFLCNEFYDLNECYPKGFQLSTFKKSTLIGEPFFYLHQLQNLFWCLCGKELVIDLQKLNKQP